MQYLGLGLYTVAEAVIFAPLLFLAEYRAGSGVIMEAGVVSIGLFLGITAVVFLTRQDFSFLGPILTIAGFIAIGLIFASKTNNQPHRVPSMVIVISAPSPETIK